LTGLLLNASMFSAFNLIPIALALMLFYTYPAGVVAVEAALGRETITPTRLAALALSSAGVVLVLAGGLYGSAGGLRVDGLGLVVLALVAPARSCSCSSAARGTGPCRRTRRCSSTSACRSSARWPSRS
jgi:drug/metabolite transporter (DMT)-like permease